MKNKMQKIIENNFLSIAIFILLYMEYDFIYTILEKKTFSIFNFEDERLFFINRYRK